MKTIDKIENQHIPELYTSYLTLTQRPSFLELNKLVLAQRLFINDLRKNGHEPDLSRLKINVDIAIKRSKQHLSNPQSEDLEVAEINEGSNAMSFRKF